MGQAGISNAPKNSNNWARNQQAILKLQAGDFTLQGHYLQTKTGDSLGFVGALSSAADPGWLKAVDAGLFASYNHEWGKANIMARIGLSKHTLSSYLPVYPAGFASPLPANNPLFIPLGGVLTYPTGMTQRSNYEERQKYATIEWQQKLAEHEFLLGVNYTHSAPRDLWIKANFDPITLLPFSIPAFQPLGMRGYSGAKNWLREGVSRRNVALYLQDTMDIGKSMSLTGGIRYDDFSDTKNSVTPRLAAVYRLTDEHIFKAQFATAFRPPTFLEMHVQFLGLHGDINLKPETSKVFELGYIYKTSNSIARLTLFSNINRNLITVIQNQYTNLNEVITNGAEVELERSFSHSLKFSGNLTYSKARNKQTNAPLEGSTTWLANATASYKPMHGTMLQVSAHYVGARHRAINDARPDLASYTTVDLAGTLANIMVRGLDLRIGVRNIFDATVLTPLATNLSPQDFALHNGQQRLWSELSWAF